MFTQKPKDGGWSPDLNGHPAPIEVRKIGARLAPASQTRSEARQTPTNGEKHSSDAVAGDGYVLVGKGTKINGDISNCTLVEIQGVLEGSVIADCVIIRDGGGFKGMLQTDQAEVHGVIEGTVVVHELLDIRANGNVQGDLTYGRISISEGGVVSGSLQTKSALQAEPPPTHDVSGDVFARA